MYEDVMNFDAYDISISIGILYIGKFPNCFFSTFYVYEQCLYLYALTCFSARTQIAFTRKHFQSPAFWPPLINQPHKERKLLNALIGIRNLIATPFLYPIGLHIN